MTNDQDTKRAAIETLSQAVRLKVTRSLFLAIADLRWIFLEERKFAQLRSSAVAVAPPLKAASLRAL